MSIAIFGILILAGFVAALFALAVLLVSVETLVVRYRIPAIERTEAEKVPVEYKALYAAVASELQKLDFQPCCYLRRQRARTRRADVFDAVFLHPQSHVVAIITARFSPPHYEEVPIFRSFYRDGTEIQTYNGFGGALAYESESVQVEEAKARSLAEQFACHLKAVHEKSAVRFGADGPLELDADRIVLLLNQHEDEAFRSMVTNGRFVKTSAGTFRYSCTEAFCRAVRAIIRHYGGGRRRAAASSAATRKANPMLDRDFVVKALLDPNDGSSAEKISKRKKLALLVISMMLTFFAFGGAHAAGIVALLLGVLLFHELGHLLGLWLFGCPNLSVIFIPFFGAVTTGRRDHVKAYQDAIIIFLGPLPGIIAGFLLIFSGVCEGSPLMTSLALMLLLINGFNLLPVMPLDGGQIINLALSRRPIAAIIFQALGFVVLLVLGLVSGNGVLVWIGALLLWQTVRGRRRSYAINLFLKKTRGQIARGEMSTDPEIASAIAELLQGAEFCSLNGAVRLASARSLFGRAHVKAPGFLQSLLLASSYLAIMALIPTALIWHFLPKEARRLASIAVERRIYGCAEVLDRTAAFKSEQWSSDVMRDLYAGARLACLVHEQRSVEAKGLADSLTESVNARVKGRAATIEAPANGTDKSDVKSIFDRKADESLQKSLDRVKAKLAETAG